MSDKVYGFCSRNKCKREVMPVDIIETVDIQMICTGLSALEVYYDKTFGVATEWWRQRRLINAEVQVLDANLKESGQINDSDGAIKIIPGNNSLRVFIKVNDRSNLKTFIPNYTADSPIKIKLTFIKNGYFEDISNMLTAS